MSDVIYDGCAEPVAHMSDVIYDGCAEPVAHMSDVIMSIECSGKTTGCEIQCILNTDTCRTK